MTPVTCDRAPNQLHLQGKSAKASHLQQVAGGKKKIKTKTNKTKQTNKKNPQKPDSLKYQEIHVSFGYQIYYFGSNEEEEKHSGYNKKIYERFKHSFILSEP